ncbi:hypothetical protein [Arthrobacter crystallopoietes]|uniref:Metallo-beta-lactamase superfamily protein n=1 Tax=Crystallibacter crystallopoietes TaxID=37928 RepID=A0A1H1CWG1_9MICC|nr:hypothetical protein [Arthrobacter crystallopoietes]AUI50574.1 hypothetical protein AC20117_06760 [Arthrobacter crystallopoietes]SDQ68554.1 hypothetical protein SAMN04489742_2129 [Arthrobacter crystallopoietes]
MTGPATVSRSGSFTPGALADGRVHRLGGTIELDANVSWCPDGIRKNQDINCYLIKGQDGSVLVDTGVRLHQENILAQLDELLQPGEPLSIVLTRTEMECCLNIPAIEARCSVEAVWYTGGITVPRSAAKANRIAVDPGTALELDVGYGIVLELISPLLRLLPTLWVHDPASGVLLTSDAFTHGSEPEADPRDGLRKFEWFTEADTHQIADHVLQVVRERTVTAIGPGYGTPFSGIQECADQAGELARVLREVGVR